MIELKGGGMNCRDCLHAVDEALQGISGISRVDGTEFRSACAPVRGGASPQAWSSAIEAVWNGAEPVAE